MLDVNLSFDNINILNIDKNDLVDAYELIQRDQEYFRNSFASSRDLKELYERFLECYISENEFFLKLNKSSKLIGLLKGRLEFKSVPEMWIWYFVLDPTLRSTYFGSNLLNEIIGYFKNQYGVKEFYTTTEKSNINAINFFKNNGYDILRISRNFYNINGEYKDMIILKKRGN
ncbi:GNAT family N-acetyltransferase [Clostridium rectalis]|uniref:GNAT family N-acetyltransferase n=1 Tax=Clostridium rectalis TaxID=2040295 RepID=UPI000F633F4B|nr:GNAT family N-acetyltransferase [Clostridium rectalis]